MPVPRLVVLALLCSSAVAAAQAMPPEVHAVVADRTPLVLTQTFGKSAAASLKIGTAKPRALGKGEAASTLVVGHDRTIVALGTTAKDAPFRIHVVEGDRIGEAIAIARPGSRHDVPFAAVGCATSTGFALFFQEIQSDDPSAAHTYLVELDKSGQPSGAAREVPVPWSLAAAIDNGRGYHLALIYPNDGMRLSMVELDPKGQPRQHPDWASPRGLLSEVHLVASGAKIRAIYRSNNRILESDVTKIRDWGSEPPAPKQHGAIASKQVLAVDASGKIVKVAR